MSVLENVCLKEIIKQQKLSPNNLSFLQNVLRQYIHHELAFDEAKAQLARARIDTGALTLARDYISTENDPIPPSRPQIEEYRHSSRKKQLNPWSDYEDKRLTMGVHKYGSSDWDSVARFVGNNRTRAQCAQRWERTLDPSISKDPWTPEEEKALDAAVKKYGSKSWTKVANQLPGRTDVQCRYHYKYVLNGSSPKALKLQEMKKQEQKVQPASTEQQKDMMSFLDKVFLPDELICSTDNFYPDEWLSF